MTRQTKTSQQRAQEALDVAQRRVDKADKDVARLDAQFTAARAVLREARARRDYLAQDPALAPDPEPKALPDREGEETPA